MRSARIIIGSLGVALVATSVLWLGLGPRSTETLPLALVFVLGFALTIGSLLARVREVERVAKQQAAQIQAQLVDLERVRERAEISSTAKSSFLANMSHELRTPLNAIIGYAELIAEELQDRGDALGEFAADIERIQLSARHLLALITDILDISKIEAGEVKVEIRTVDFARVIKDVRASTELLIHKRGNRFSVELEPELGTLDTDTHKLRQILINLLGNAAKFTEGGQVTLAIRREGEHVCFDVIDTGIGIAPHKLELLFEPFVQADTSSSRRFGGTGLGLTISRHFAQLLGGSLTAISEPGRGSTFTLTLPRERDSQAVRT